MAMTILDLGDDDCPAVPLVATRIDGELGSPLVIVPGAMLSPADAVEYAKRIFAAAAAACRQSRQEVVGHC